MSLLTLSLLLMALPAAVTAAEWSSSPQCPSSFPPAEEGIVGDPADERTQTFAPSQHSDEAGNSQFNHGVDLRQGTRRMTARRATLKKASDDVEADGDVTLRDTGIAVQGDSLRGNLASDTARIENAEYQLEQKNARGQASSLELLGRERLVLNDSRFTTCPVGRQDWSMDADVISINRSEGWGEAEDMVLRVADVPVFYTPYLTFPVDDRRRSGFLFPSLGHSERTGFDAALPYYFNLAPHYDATLTPRIMSERGVMLGGELRYLGESFSSEVAGEYLPDDDGETIAESTERYSYSVKHNQRLGGGFSAALDINDVSDDQYFHDLDTDLGFVDKEVLTRNASLNYASSHWSVSALASDYRVLSTPAQPYELMPQLSLSGNYPRLAGDLDLAIGAQVTQFDHETMVTATRSHLAPRLSYPLEWAAGYIRPSVSYWLTQYQQDIETQPGTALADQTTRSAPVMSVDSGLVFEREGANGSIQTLEPRLFYLYVPERDQNGIGLYDSSALDSSFPQLFAENRFNGIDRLGDANQWTAALTNRWLHADGGEAARFSIGQIFYQADRQVQLYPGLAAETESRSGLIGEAAWHFAPNWNSRGHLEWDTDADQTSKAQFGIYFADDEGYAFNARHRFRRPQRGAGDNLEQGDISFAAPVASNWRVVGRYNRDLVNDQDIEVLGGLEYSSCCWALRVVGRRHLDVLLDANGAPMPRKDESDTYSNGVFVEFIFRGLAGVGNNGSGAMLERSIQGYRDTLGP